MALPRIGGETPIIKYGTELSVEAPNGTDADSPVLPGQIFKLGGTGADGTGFKVVPAVANDDAANSILVYALHRCDDINVPLGVKLVTPMGLCQVRRIPYSAAPTIGQSIKVGATVTKIAGQAWAAGKGYVLAVDTDALDAEVLV